MRTKWKDEVRITRFMPVVCSLAMIAICEPLPTEAGAERGGWMYAPCDRGIDDSRACIERLLTQYPGDGAASLELGPQLGKALVAHPADFFSVASRHPQEFDAWLAGLGDSTFAILEESDSVEAALQAAYLEKLRTLMSSALSSFPKSSPHAGLAARTAVAISKIQVVP